MQERGIIESNYKIAKCPEELFPIFFREKLFIEKPAAVGTRACCNAKKVSIIVSVTIISPNPGDFANAAAGNHGHDGSTSIRDNYGAMSYFGGVRDMSFADYHGWSASPKQPGATTKKKDRCFFGHKKVRRL